MDNPQLEMAKLNMQVKGIKKDIKKIEDKIDSFADRLIPIVDLKIENSTKKLEAKLYGAVIGLTVTVLVEIGLLIFSIVLNR